MKLSFLSVVAAMGLLLVTPTLDAHARHAMKPAPRVVISGAVIAGNPKSFAAVATVDRRSVFLAIPAYQRIVRKKLDKRDARYHFLLREANRVFRQALSRSASQTTVDLVVEAGGVEATGLAVMDLTERVIKEIHTGNRSGRKQSETRSQASRR